MLEGEKYPIIEENIHPEVPSSDNQLCLTQKDVEDNVDVQDEECGGITNMTLSARMESDEEDVNCLTANQKKLSHVHRERWRPNQSAEKKHTKKYTKTERKKRKQLS